MSKRRAESEASASSTDEDVDAVVSTFFERVEDFHEQRRINKTTFALNIARQVERNDVLAALRATIDTLDAVRGKDVVAEPKKKKSKTGVHTPSQKLTVSTLLFPFSFFLLSCAFFHAPCCMCACLAPRRPCCALARVCVCARACAHVRRADPCQKGRDHRHWVARR